MEFEVGVPRQTALVRLYNQVYRNQDFVPPGLGVGPPLIRPMGIDDVPVMALTLWTDDPARGATELAEVAHMLEVELKRIPGTRDVYTIGAPDRAVLVELDAAKLAAYGLTIDDLAGALKAANVVDASRAIASTGNRDVPVTAGTFLADADEVADLVIGLNNGQPVFLSDVAKITQRRRSAQRYVWFGAPPGKAGPKAGTAPAVTIAIAKKTGTNAADITTAVVKRLDALKGIDDPRWRACDRDARLWQDRHRQGRQADPQADLRDLLGRAAGAGDAGLARGHRRRQRGVITLMLTLFASWAMGFTINRVSLFALIFSIGILVDDAIVIVENIHRHQALGHAASLKQFLQRCPKSAARRFSRHSRSSRRCCRWRSSAG